MTVDKFTAADIDLARQAVSRGEMTTTLVAKEGERFLLRDLGTLCRSLDGMLRAITKEVAPGERVDWCVTSVGLAGDNLSVTVGGFKPRPRKRR